MSNNKSLRKADKIEFDEYYTQYVYIQKEINAYLEYNPDVFKDKIILLPCDDPEWSNFTKFFAQNFERFGLKKLISTSYAAVSKRNKYKNEFYQLSFFEESSPKYDKEKSKKHGKIFTLERNKNRNKKIDINDLEWDYLEGDGDFRSDEIIKLRDEADYVITNPPFSLFREFVRWIVDGGNKFLVIGSQNAITYKEIFPYIKDNLIWLGATCNSEDMVFEVPEGTEIAKNDREKAAKLGYVGNFTRLGNSCWFTNIDHGIRHQSVQLMTMKDNLKFSKHKALLEKGYEKYDHYNAINIPYSDSIPIDYCGLMGVPISFLYKYNPEQFEIVDGIGRYSIMHNEESKKAKKYLSMINGEAKFFRIIIVKKGVKYDENNFKN